MMLFNQLSKLMILIKFSLFEVYAQVEYIKHFLV